MSAVGPHPLTVEKVSVAKGQVTSYYQHVVEEGKEFVKEHTKARSKKMSVRDFDILKVIGTGAFGEVRLCHLRGDPAKRTFAMKSLLKSHMISSGHVKHVRAERDLMVEARRRALQSGESNWIVDLYYSFQDDECLYFVMEFCPGGDLMTWLIKLDVFEDPIAKFYTAELVEAVHTLHSMNYAHRDLKPDNILIDATGHIKLTDFGLSKLALQCENSSSAPDDREDQPLADVSETSGTVSRHAHSRATFRTIVGSPGYTAPEILEGRAYGMSCDWWSVGVILYEMLVGYPPFCSENNISTAQKIVRWREFLEFPEGLGALKASARDLISKLLCDAQDRLGYEQIIQHPFFSGIEWMSLRKRHAPLRIQLSGPTDTRYFDPPDAQVSHRPRTHMETPPGEHRYLFSGFTAKFEGAQPSSAPGKTRQAAAGIPTFDGLY